MTDCIKCGYPLDKHPSINDELHCVARRTPSQRDLNNITYEIRVMDQYGVETVSTITCNGYQLAGRITGHIMNNCQRLRVTAKL